MPKKTFSPEQIVTLLPRIEVLFSQPEGRRVPEQPAEGILLSRGAAKWMPLVRSRHHLSFESCWFISGWDCRRRLGRRRRTGCPP
jgi:hypothetical protein